MDLTPPEMIRIASRAGYDFVGIRFIPMGVPGEHAYLPEDKEMIRKTKAALDERGIRLLDLELAQIVTDRDPKLCAGHGNGGGVFLKPMGRNVKGRVHCGGL